MTAELLRVALALGYQVKLFTGQGSYINHCIILQKENTCYSVVHYTGKHRHCIYQWNGRCIANWSLVFPYEGSHTNSEWGIGQSLWGSRCCTLCFLISLPMSKKCRGITSQAVGNKQRRVGWGETLAHDALLLPVCIYRPAHHRLCCYTTDCSH